VGIEGNKELKEMGVLLFTESTFLIFGGRLVAICAFSITASKLCIGPQNRLVTASKTVCLMLVPIEY